MPSTRPKVHVDLVYTTDQLAQLCADFLVDELDLKRSINPDLALANVESNSSYTNLTPAPTPNAPEDTPSVSSLTSAWIYPFLSKLPDWGNTIVATTVLALRHLHAVTQSRSGSNDDEESTSSGTVTSVLGQAPLQVLFVLSLLRACDVARTEYLVSTAVTELRARVVKLACGDPTIEEFLISHESTGRLKGLVGSPTSTTRCAVYSRSSPGDQKWLKEQALDALQEEFEKLVKSVGEEFGEVREFEEGLVERYMK